MITQEFLSEVVQFVDSKIAKVVINESFEIRDFEMKQAGQSLVRIEYTVPNRSVNTIHLIQLKDNEGLVVSSNTVHVPITSDTLIQQTIKIEEG